MNPPRIEISGLIEEGFALGRHDAPAPAPNKERDGRLEGLCDGIFGFALTLLVIDVKLPGAESISSAPELWAALADLLPAALAFLLSFVIVLITWVNHRASLRLVAGSTLAFVYANGFLLLTVVLLPVPTALMGAFLWTDRAAPAVAMYDAVLAFQALGWVVVSLVARRNQLVVDADADAAMRDNGRNGVFACALYAGLAVTALWAPLTVAAITTASWMFWLVHGVQLDGRSPNRLAGRPETSHAQPSCVARGPRRVRA